VRRAGARRLRAGLERSDEAEAGGNRGSPEGVAATGCDGGRGRRPLQHVLPSLCWGLPAGYGVRARLRRPLVRQADREVAGDGRPLLLVGDRHVAPGTGEILTGVWLGRRQVI